ncbi:hypothetical protein KKG29_04610 [Patescibacteria group bacterium]|nr:hypothetical protein [Patescibacteria group bacterium]MBU4000419.1 hypothetical protein [Patescibacteria group bacterium]MBU4056386.1 hypothetical protein [Patescibacteria group bacterium]MBU4368195.1 hypothetical protein [Patescibacteria group bacterium]
MSKIKWDKNILNASASIEVSCAIFLIYAMIIAVTAGLIIASYILYTHKNFPEAIVAFFGAFVVVATCILSELKFNSGKK